MDMMRWGPVREMQEMSERLNRLLERPGQSQRAQESGTREALTVADCSPNVDTSETEAEYLIRVEVPDVRKEDARITVQEGVLVIQGIKHEADKRSLARIDSTEHGRPAHRPR